MARKQMEVVVNREDPQYIELREIVRKNGVDAWDLGFQGQMSPGQTDEAVQYYLNTRGYAEAKKMLLTLKKR